MDFQVGVYEVINVNTNKKYKRSKESILRMSISHKGIPWSEARRAAQKNNGAKNA